MPKAVCSSSCCFVVVVVVVAVLTKWLKENDYYHTAFGDVHVKFAYRTNR
jgi:hypothetical protein